jgi:hypothetical protein
VGRNKRSLEGRWSIPCTQRSREVVRNQENIGTLPTVVLEGVFHDMHNTSAKLIVLFFWGGGSGMHNGLYRTRPSEDHLYTVEFYSDDNDRVPLLL